MIIPLTVGSKQAIGYLRVSGPGQVGERHSSLDTQQERFLFHCKRQGYRPGRTFCDVMSGRRDDRREYQAMLSYVRANKPDVIVVQWLDRFGRNPREILRRYWELEEAGVTVEATDEDLKEEMLLLVRAGMAGAVSRRISARVRANMAKAVTKGVHVGTDPYGLHQVRSFGTEGGRSVVRRAWEIVPAEAEVIRHIWRMLVQENKGYLAVADALNAMGYRTRRGKIWRAGNVSWVIRSESLNGRMVYGKEGGQELVSLDDFFPEILTDAEWKQLQERLAIRREMPRGKRHVSEYLLSGVLRCGHCGGPMKGKTSSYRLKSGEMRPYRTYVCLRNSVAKAACPVHNYHRVKPLEDVVLSFLSQYSDPKRVQELLAKDAKPDTAGLDAQLAGAEKRLAALDRDFLQNLDLLKRGLLNDTEFDKANQARRQERQTLEARHAELKARIEAAKRRMAQAEAVPGKLASFLEAMRSMDVRQAKAMLQTIVKEVHVYRDGKLEVEFRV
ncbi:MAG: recombinase family protein [Chloroflexota bacterium]|nr:recombinase family protein [Chloroflexota bacterium]